MIVSFNEPTTTIYTRMRLLDGFFCGILVGLICHPVLYGLPGTFWIAIVMNIVNPVVYKGRTPSIKHTLVFGDGHTDKMSPFQLPLIHRLDRPTLSLVLTRTSQ